jgi:hydroxymethylbilane synthase
MATAPTFFIATRGSPLARAQAGLILDQCRAAFPQLGFELKIIKTTGDKLQTASPALEGQGLPKGLFTKELELALLEGKAELAVHSLKDLPTELPAGLKLGAIGGRRADVRDVLIYRAAGTPARGSSNSSTKGFPPNLAVQNLPAGAVVATSSTRRKSQLLTLNSALRVTDIRGNVVTRLEKLAATLTLDATILALAGMERLGIHVTPDGSLAGPGIPRGLLATILTIEEMLPCVGQGALGLEVRDGHERAATVCERLNDLTTLQCVTAERAFLAGMGGGCQSPVAAYGEVINGQLRLRAVSFADGPARRGEVTGPPEQAAELGRQLAARLQG